MTDVTGFGLAGHLLEILERFRHRWHDLDLPLCPLLPGAEALAAMGIASTLAPANRAACTLGRTRFTDSPRAALLFDPQTAGGLLAAVPADQAQSLVESVLANGDRAAIIGHVSDGPIELVVTNQRGPTAM